jgi:hypothetical protein
VQSASLACDPFVKGQAAPRTVEIVATKQRNASMRQMGRARFLNFFYFLSFPKIAGWV